MKAFKWIKIWFLIIIASPLLALFNYLIDPYGFNKYIMINNINAIKEDNTPFTIKYKMPRLREGGWDNLILGTSRIGGMDTVTANKYLGGKTFTMSQPASAMPIQFDSFLYAIKFNNVKNIVYGIDFMTFNKNLKFNDDYLQLKDELQSFGRFDTYDIYFNIKTLLKSIQTIINNRSDAPKLYIFYSESGMRNYPNFKQELLNGDLNLETKIHKHLQAYFKKDGIYANYEYSTQYMQMFETIVKHCHENNIHLYVYIPPMYVEHFYAIGSAGLKGEFEKFKKELAKITDFIDFTGVNSITSNKNNYWDSSHLRKEHTGTIMEKVIKNRPTEGHQDFGVRVTMDNIEEHLKKQEGQYKKINLNKILDISYNE